MKAITWTIKDLVKVAKDRQNNKFDCNMVVSGNRGNGKSTFLFKLFTRLGDFKPWKQQVYSRKDVITLLEGQKFGIIFDDEAIRSGYKRNFFDSEQKKLITMLNMYRDNFNVYGSAVPKFYSLDKDFRDLVKIHIHIIKRGIGVVHIAHGDSLYSDDVWDVKYNKKVEESWIRKIQKNPNFTPPFHKLTTFRGYIYFGDLTPNQREVYEKVKVVKRKRVYEEEMKEDGEKTEENTFYNNIMERLKGGNLTKESLQEVCLINGKKLSTVTNYLNTKLRDSGAEERVNDLLIVGEIKPIHNNKMVNKRLNTSDYI
jgi:hypothetical protein